MADNETATDEGFWLDIPVHKRVHQKLKAWGKRLGLTPEGYAKMLILQQMHGLLADEVAHEAHVKRSTREPAADAPDATELSRSMWQAVFDQYGDTPDLLPAPAAVSGQTRYYKAEDFAWADGTTPPHSEAAVEGNTVVRTGH